MPYGSATDAMNAANLLANRCSVAVCGAPHRQGHNHASLLAPCERSGRALLLVRAAAAQKPASRRSSPSKTNPKRRRPARPSLTSSDDVIALKRENGGKEAQSSQDNPASSSTDSSTIEKREKVAPVSGFPLPSSGLGKADRVGSEGAAAEFSSSSSLPVSSTSPPLSASPSLPSTSAPPSSISVAAAREKVFQACLVTSAGMAAAGVGVRQLSSWASAAGLPVNDCTTLIRWLPSSDSVSSQVSAVAGVVLGVSAARFLLIRLSPSFAEASSRSNAQVLTNLSATDLLWVSALPGISEEMLFRGALMPLVGANMVGAVVAGVVFGGLHLSGGRNTTFVAWASAVGLTYGLLTLHSSDLLSPMLAHSVANIIAAGAWKLENARDGQE